MGLKAFAKKATEVVLEVVAVALAALLKEYASLILMSPLINLMFSLCLQASTKTKMSSAAIPNTMKITSECKLE